MPSQIETLTAAFDKMTTVQKGQFIAKLKIQIQKSKSAENIKFLGYCVQQYNMEVQEGLDSRPASVAPAPVHSNSAEKNKKKSKIFFIFGFIAVFVVIVFALFPYLSTDKNKIIGSWVSYHSSEFSFLDYNATYTFNADLTYTVKLDNQFYHNYSGTYKLTGNTLTMNEPSNVVLKYKVNFSDGYLIMTDKHGKTEQYRRK